MPPASHHATEIALTGMRFHVRVGILPHERELPQPLEIDVRVGRRAGAAAVLDYRALYAAASEVATAGPLDYLEEIGEAVLMRALALDAVQWGRVAVRKPHVALAGPLEHAEVVVEGRNA